jgi:hypothetical protein
MMEATACHVMSVWQMAFQTGFTLSFVPCPALVYLFDPWNGVKSKAMLCADQKIEAGA